VGGFSWYFFHSETRRHIQEIFAGELLHTDYGHLIIDSEIQSTISDIRLLSLQNEFHEHLATNDDLYLKALDRECRAVLAYRNCYNRIRYVNLLGETILDIVKLPSSVVGQDFTQAFRQGCMPSLDKPYQVYSAAFSQQDFDNIKEFEEINLVFSFPIRDEDNTIKGFVQIFYSMRELAKRIRLSLSRENSTSMLLAPDGRLLLLAKGKKDPALLAEGSNDFVHRFSGPWLTVASSERGQFLTSNGLFTFATVHLAKNGNGAFPFLSPYAGPELDRAGYHLKLVAFQPREHLSTYGERLLVGTLTPSGIMFALLSLAAWIISGRITKRKMQAARLFARAYFDELTGLPNRGLLFDRLNQSMGLSRRYGQKFALLYIDLNNFKNVNDLYGHATGDEVLRHVAERLSGLLRGSDTAARMGGDEFVVLLHQIHDRSDAESVACKIARSITQPYHLGEQELHIGASVGVSLFPDDGDSQDNLLRSADMSMYADKGRRRSQATADCPDK
jgi:diguanylate cyclase (GGDEF)-like protein